MLTGGAPFAGRPVHQLFAAHLNETPAPIAHGIASISTIAVLPFGNTGDDPKDEYFSDGMTDELAHALSRVPGLRLAGRTSSFAFKGKNVPAQEIGRTLGVAGLVEGTVRRAGDRLRITAQLTSTDDGKVLWSDTYERSAGDVFAVQDELTRAIVAALTPTLRGAPAAQVTGASRGTEDAEAYDLYLRGRYSWSMRGAENLVRAASYFRRAVQKDPRFARAHAGLAMTYR
jgi:TolB-like protein